MKTTSSPDSFELSRALHHGATQYLAGGVNSNFRLGGPVPLFYSHAQGSKLYSVDGQTYLDYALGMGAVILGHAPPRVIERVSESFSLGQLYGGEHQAEQILARTLCSKIPSAERVRFGSSGSELIQAALRLSRAYTGRQKIIKFEGHYHGWFDNIYVGVHPKVYGTPEPESEGQLAAAFQEILVLPWNDIDALESVLRASWQDIAAVIMEPVLCNTSVIVPRPGYLERVRELCSLFSVVLIFDEVITGFRVDLHGAQGLLGVTPDLAIFAKALAAGFPISCLAGKAELMELLGSGRVMHGGTYNANVISVAASIATLEELAAGEGAVFRDLYRRGEELIRELRCIAKALGVPLLVQGLGPVFNCTFNSGCEITDYRSYQYTDTTRLARFLTALLYRGVRVTRRGTWFLSTAHSDRDIEDTLRAAHSALQEVR